MSSKNLKERLAKASENSRLQQRGQENKEDLKRSMMTEEQPPLKRYHLFGNPHDLQWLKEVEHIINDGAKRKEKTNRSELIRAAIHLLKQKNPDEIKAIIAELD